MAKKKTNRDLYFKILDNDLYHFGIMFCLGHKQSEVLKRVERFIPNWKIEFPEHYIGCCFVHPEKATMLIHMHERPITASQFSVLQHEIAHATFAIMRHKDIPINRDTEEVYAYLMEYISVNTWKDLWK